MMLMTMLYNFLDTAFNSALLGGFRGYLEILRLMLREWLYLCGNGADLSGNLYFKQNFDRKKDDDTDKKGVITWQNRRKW